MISVQLDSQIKLNYGFGNIREISRLEGGYWNQTLKLATEKGEFVLRISRPRTKPESISYQHALMRFMNSKMAKVPAPVTLIDGQTFFVADSCGVTLLPFIEGETASRKLVQNQIG